MNGSIIFCVDFSEVNLFASRSFVVRSISKSNIEHSMDPHSNLELVGVLSAFDLLASRMTVSQSNTGIFLRTDERYHHTEDFISK